MRLVCSCVSALRGAEKNGAGTPLPACYVLVDVENTAAETMMSNLKQASRSQNLREGDCASLSLR